VDRDHPDARSAFPTFANVIVVKKDVIAHCAHVDVGFVVALEENKHVPDGLCEWEQRGIPSSGCSVHAFLKSARLTKASRGRSLRESARQRHWRAILSSHEKSKRPVYVEL
jgi:hypothetical protein